MINVVIPSYKRANNLPGKDYFTMAKYVVPESQKEEYIKELGEDRVIAIPDEHDGSIVKKRNWILKNIPRPLLMIDDDIKDLLYFDNRHSDYCQRPFPKELLPEFFENSLILAEQFGCKMWGLAQNYDPRVYLDFKPFSLTCVILGPFQCHLEHDLTFDERMGSKEDYDMSLQQLRKFKKILRINKFAYRGKFQENAGGICSYRTIEKEVEWCENIIKKWGSNIIKYKLPPEKLADVRNGKTFIPIKGV